MRGNWLLEEDARRKKGGGGGGEGSEVQCSGIQKKVTRKGGTEEERHTISLTFGGGVLIHLKGERCACVCVWSSVCAGVCVYALPRDFLEGARAILSIMRSASKGYLLELALTSLLPI